MLSTGSALSACVAAADTTAAAFAAVMVWQQHVLGVVFVCLWFVCLCLTTHWLCAWHYTLQDVRKAQSLGFAFDSGITIVQADVTKGAK